MEKQLESHRREITALFCDLRGFTGFSEFSDPEDVMALLSEYHAGIGEIIIHGYATLGTIGFEGRFDYAAIGTVSNVASRLCDEANRAKY